MQKRILVASKNSDEDTRYAARSRLNYPAVPRIIIIGAGVSGLAFAQGLHRRGIDFSVYERCNTLDSRHQSHRIRIPGVLKDKVRALLTEEAWAEFEATCAETQLGETTLNAPDASVVASRKGRLLNGNLMPYTVDRGMMRKSFLKGIEQHVHFGKKFLRYEIDENEVMAFFGDGTVEHGAFLVGADGRHSAVRQQLLPKVKPFDTEGCVIYGKSFLGPELIAQFPEKHRRWMTVIRDQAPLLQSIDSGDAPITLVLDPIHFINQYRRNDLPADYIFWALVFHGKSTGLNSVQLTESLKTRAVELSLDMTGEWESSLRALLELQETSLTTGMRIFSANPEIPTWEPSAHVTLVGDAIHVMSEPGGIGAAAALNDASVLVQTIAEEGISAASIGRYEDTMRAFASMCIRKSHAAGERLIGLPDFDNILEVEW
ncbi:MAG: hypothetical protein M1820_000760 [Bogoriella megaspora]|nr:MAG: hypothetical protein M1820_000760 [Bogoriella megaspora]